MSTQQTSSDPAELDFKVEVVQIPVSDIERAKAFYAGLGWRLDADFTIGANFRGIQFTPPGSPASIHFGKGVTGAAPGKGGGIYLVVSDIEAARSALKRRGVNVSETFHFDGAHERVPGPDPEGRSYFTLATFNDPDGNLFIIQEVKVRLPGRV